MQVSLPARFALVVPAVFLGGCATLVAPPAEQFEIVSDVEASCEVTDAAGTRTAEVPGPVVADPKHAPARVACDSDGYKPYSTVVDTEFNKAMFGNLIVGGVIGAAIDIGSGSHQRYPDHVFIVMEPESFESERAREQWRAYREETLAELREEYAPGEADPREDDPSLK